MQRVDYTHPKVRWNPLQKDFQGSYTGGEVFFNTIDHILDNPKVPPIVFEVFYFMLKRGFQGKYRESKTQLLKYSDLLKEKIPVMAHGDKNSEPMRIQGAQEKVTKGRYYAVAALLFVLTGIVLYLFSSWEGI